MLFVPEPRRMGAARDVPTAGVPLSLTVDFLRSNRKTFTAIMFGAGFLYLAIYGWLGWAPTYFVRELGWTYPQVGKAFGVILAVAGPAGALGGSWLADFWRRKGVAHANLRVGVLSCAGMAVASTGMVLSASPAACVVFLALGAVFSFTLIGVGAMSLQETAPAPMRGQVAALFAGVLNIVGAGFGPVAVGLITDYVLRDPSAIGTAIVATCVTASVIGLLLFRSGFATYAPATRAAADPTGARARARRGRAEPIRPRRPEGADRDRRTNSRRPVKLVHEELTMLCRAMPVTSARQGLRCGAIRLFVHRALHRQRRHGRPVRGHQLVRGPQATDEQGDALPIRPGCRYLQAREAERRLSTPSRHLNPLPAEVTPPTGCDAELRHGPRTPNGGRSTERDALTSPTPDATAGFGAHAHGAPPRPPRRRLPDSGCAGRGS